MFDKLLEDLPIIEKENIRNISRLLLNGRTIYYIDNRGIGYSLIKGIEDLNDYSRVIYKSLQNNFSGLKNIFDTIGYELVRETHSLSTQPEYGYYYYLDELNLNERPEKLQSLQEGDILILSALIINTNRGRNYLKLYEEFIEPLIDDPRQILKIDADTQSISKLISKTGRISFEEEKGVFDRLKDDVRYRIKNNLVPYDFATVIKNDEDTEYVSIGASAFRFITLLREAKEIIEEEEE